MVLQLCFITVKSPCPPFNQSYPNRGDIVQLSGKTILVLTKEKHNRTTHSLTGVCLENGQPNITSFSSIKYVRIMPELVKKADSELLDNILKQVKTLFR